MQLADHVDDLYRFCEAVMRVAKAEADGDAPPPATTTKNKVTAPTMVKFRAKLSAMQARLAVTAAHLRGGRLAPGDYGHLAPNDVAILKVQLAHQMSHMLTLMDGIMAYFEGHPMVEHIQSKAGVLRYLDEMSAPINAAQTIAKTWGGLLAWERGDQPVDLLAVIEGHLADEPDARADAHL